MTTIEELIDTILSKSEQFEDDIKQKTNLKNLTIRQLQCIEIIYRKGNPTLTEIATGLKITKASVSVLADRLVEHGFMKRVKSDNDRRSAHVHLTPKGRKTAQLHTEVHSQFAKKLSQDLTESEKDILMVLLNKAVKNLE